MDMLLEKWDFHTDASEREAVNVPHTWNVFDKTEHYRGKGYYDTVINVPEEWLSRRIILHFGAVYHSAEVFVNGNKVFTHTGSGYTPFEAEITNAVHVGENTLSVIADNTQTTNALPYLQHFDWADDGGIIRPVRLSVHAKDSIAAVRVTPVIQTIAHGQADGVLQCAMEYYGDCKGKEIAFQLIDCQSGDCIQTFTAKAEAELRFPFSKLALWDTENPQLYRLTAELAGETFTARFGVRKIEVQGNRILLNDKEIYLTACEWMPGSYPEHGMAEPFEISSIFLNQLKNSGCVFTRFHWQQDDSIYDWCDENGLLVQEEIPYWGNPKKAGSLQVEIAKRHADEMVKAHSNHPSIICWGVGNELGGAERATIRYVDTMHAYFKGLDPTRLVNYVSNTMGHFSFNKDEATLHGDIAMWNEYMGTWQPVRNMERKMAYVIRRTGEKPLVITEFGLCEPHFKGGDERRKQILLDKVALYNQFPQIKGYVWFSLNDYRTHVGESGQGRYRCRIHGSVDLYGKEKPSYNSLCEINQEQNGRKNKR